MSKPLTPLPWKIRNTSGDPIEETGEIMSCDPLYPVPIADTGIAYWFNLRASAAHALQAGSIDREIERRQANAEFIVRACNSHYELLEQANYMDSAIGGEPNEDYADDEVIEIRVTGAFIKQLRQAIQNATK
jgi:hypothetical protein